MELIDRYVSDGFSDFSLWTEAEEMAVIDFIDSHAEEAPTLYRGLNIEIPEVGDDLYLQDGHRFASMSSSIEDAREFGDVVLVINGLSGYHAKEDEMIDEWIVEDEELEVERVEYQDDGFTLVYCR